MNCWKSLKQYQQPSNIGSTTVYKTIKMIQSDLILNIKRFRKYVEVYNNGFDLGVPFDAQI